MRRFITKLAKNAAGSMTIETAIVAPVLILMSLGTFEVGSIVSRQQEMQSAASEGEIIALAAAGGAVTELSTVKNILMTSIDLSENQVAITRFYRCNDSDVTVSNPDNCEEDDVVSSYIKLDLSDTYTPVWTQFGVGAPINLGVERTVQLS